MNIFVKLKAKAKNNLLQTVWSFGPEDIIRAIHAAGVRTGDVLMVHSRFRTNSGFRGDCRELVQAFIDAVGPEGTLCMMSMPFHGMTAKEYLQQGKLFDEKRTVSMVGLPSELFRRRKDVFRSLHPTHSVTAWGKQAQWLIEGHDRIISPFGKGSPFDKLVDLSGKILMYDVPFNTMTFEHHLEHRFSSLLPFSLYDSKIYNVECIDSFGRKKYVKTKSLSADGNRYRKSQRLFQILESEGAVTKNKIKSVEFIIVNARLSVDILIKRKSIY